MGCYFVFNYIEDAFHSTWFNFHSWNSPSSGFYCFNRLLKAKCSASLWLELQQYLYICFQLVSLFSFSFSGEDSDAESYKVVEQKEWKKESGGGNERRANTRTAQIFGFVFTEALDFLLPYNPWTVYICNIFCVVYFFTHSLFSSSGSFSPNDWNTLINAQRPFYSYVFWFYELCSAFKIYSRAHLVAFVRVKLIQSLWFVCSHFPCSRFISPSSSS